jgi:hypothetical protein
MRWVGHVAYVGEGKRIQHIVGKAIIKEDYGMGGMEEDKCLQCFGGKAVRKAIIR